MTVGTGDDVGGTEVQPPEILPTSAATPLTVQYTKRTLRMVSLSEAELDAVASPTGSIHFGFLGMSFGALVTFFVVLSTVEIADPRHYAMFVALTAVSLLASMYFGFRTALDVSASRQRLREIKAGRS